MSDIIVTWPKSRTLSSYLFELEHAELCDEVIGYKVRYKARVEKGDRCYMVHDGAIRGWTEIHGVEWGDEFWNPHKQSYMGIGWFVVRSPVWHPLADPLPMKGFRGFRYFEPEPPVT